MSNTSEPDSNLASLGLENLILDAEGLGLFLHLGNAKSPGSAARGVNDRIARGAAMPPSIEIPGMKRRLWHVPDVVIWLRGFQVPTTAGMRKRGRRPSLEKFASGAFTGNAGIALEGANPTNDKLHRRARGRPRKIDQ